MRLCSPSNLRHHDTYLYAYVKASLKKEIIFEVCGPKQTLSSAKNRVWCEKSIHTIHAYLILFTRYANFFCVESTLFSLQTLVLLVC